MNYVDWINKSYPLNISTYVKMSHKIKSLNGEQKKQIQNNKEMNINV